MFVTMVGVVTIAQYRRLVTQGTNRHAPVKEYAKTAFVCAMMVSMEMNVNSSMRESVRTTAQTKGSVFNLTLAFIGAFACLEPMVLTAP